MDLNCKPMSQLGQQKVSGTIKACHKPDQLYKHGPTAGNNALRASHEFPSQGEAESQELRT